VGYFLYYGVILCAGSLFGLVNFAHPYLCTNDDYSFLHHLTIGGWTPTAGQFLIGLALLQCTMSLILTSVTPLLYLCCNIFSLVRCVLWLYVPIGYDLDSYHLIY
jgi:hypothetical protein